MKKILFFHHNTSVVGAGLSALHILSNIPREEYEIVVSIPNGNGILGDKVERMGIRVRRDFDVSCSYTHVNGYHYNFFSVSHLHNVCDLLKSKIDVERVLIDEKPDIVMVNSMTLFWIGKLARQIGAKTVCFHRETFYDGGIGVRTRYIKKRLNNDFDKIVFLSNYDKEQTGTNENRYVKITDKVDVLLYESIEKNEARAELGLPENDKLILFTGGVSKLKGIEVILQMLHLMRTDARLVVLAYDNRSVPLKGWRKIRQTLRRYRGKDTQYWVEQYIEEKNLSGQLILRGQTDEVEKYFVACDLVVFPSQEAHQARPIFEAGIARRPIVVSDFPNTREFLDDSNGWCVGATDISKWAKICDELLQGGELIERKVQMNYDRVVCQNALEKHKKELVNLLLELIS